MTTADRIRLSVRVRVRVRVTVGVDVKNDDLLDGLSKVHRYLY